MIFAALGRDSGRATGRRAASRRGAIAKDCGLSSRSVRQRVAALTRGDPAPRCVGGVERRLTPKLLDEIREFTEEDHWRISVKIVSYGITLSRTRSPKDIRGLRPSVIRTVLHLEDRHILDQSRRLDSDVICFSDETSPELTLWLQVTVSHILSGKRRNVTTRPPFAGYTVRKRRRPIVTSAQFF